MTSLKDRTITAFVWRLFERGGNQCVALLVQIVMARLLAPSDFGLLAILLVIINIGNTIVLSGLGNSLVQMQRARKIDFTTVFWTMLLISVAMYALIFGLSPLIASIYDAPILIDTLRMLGFLFPLSAIESIQTAHVQRDLKFKVLFYATTISTVVSGLVGVVLAISGMGLWSLVFQQIAYHLSNCIALAAQTRWLPSMSFDKKIARKHFSYGWKIMLPSLMETLYDSLSDLLSGKQFGANDLGFLSQGKKFPVAIDSMITGTIQPVLLAAISRAQSDISAVKSITKRTLRTSAFFVAPIMSCFALTAPQIIYILLGEQWLPAVPFLQAYCISSALSSFHAINFESFNGVGRSDLFLKTKIITVFYSVCFMLVAIFVFSDIHAVAAAYAFSSVISTFVNAFPNRKLIGYPYKEQIKDILPSIATAGLSCMFVFPLSCIGFPAPVVLLLQWAAFLLFYSLISLISNREQILFLYHEIESRLKKTTQ